MEKGQGSGLSRSDARTICRALNEGWVSADHIRATWGEEALALVASEKLRIKSTGLELIKSMRLADLKEREVAVKEREIALKEQQAEDAKRLRLLKQLAGLDPGELAKRAEAIGVIIAADGRTGQPGSIDVSQASQGKGHQDTSTKGLEG